MLGGETGSDWPARMRESFEVWNRDGLDVFAKRFWHPEIVWEEPPGFPDAGIHRGRERCVRRMNERLSLLGHVRLELVTVTGLGEDQVLAEAVVHGQGSSSGAPVELREWFLMRMRGEEGIVHFQEFLDRDSALAAAERDG